MSFNTRLGTRFLGYDVTGPVMTVQRTGQTIGRPSMSDHYRKESYLIKEDTKPQTVHWLETNERLEPAVPRINLVAACVSNCTRHSSCLGSDVLVGLRDRIITRCVASQLCTDALKSEAGNRDNDFEQQLSPEKKNQAHVMGTNRMREIH